MGSEGADVMKLQQFLNSYPDLRVAMAGSAGSAGMETMYYGPATAAAVSKMQVMFRAEILTPNALVNPTGYFGASSRAKANDLCVTPVVVDGEEEEEEGSEEEEEERAFELSGDGFLDDVQTDDEEDEVGEGEEDVVVAMYTLEADGGDIEVARMTFDLNFTGSSTVADDEAWDVFETFALWVDGDMIAEMDASDEDDYLSDDQQTVRFTNLGLVIEEGEEVEVLFAVSAQNSVDGAEEELANWNVGFIEARVFDADGVASNETTVGEMSATNATGNATTNLVEFEVVEEGTDDGADINGSSNTPDDTTEVVDDGNDDSDEYVVHVFDIEVDNDSGDLEVGDAYADVTMANPAANADIDGGQRDVIDGIFMTIDGETVEGEAVTGAADVENDPIVAGLSTVVRYRFEFDQNVVLEGDEDYEVEVSMVFKGQNNGSNYENGVEVVTDVTGSQWEVEGSANDDELDGSDTSETLTLSAADVDVTNYGWTSPDAGTFLDFNFTVEANEENFNVLLADFDYATSGTATTAGPVLSRTAGDATENVAGSDYTVENGDTATFRIRWNLNGVNGDTFDVTATSVAGRTIPDDEEVSPTVIRNVN